ncbi:MAG TPA: excinuclease ABC subunit UvrA [Bacteroidales bacterium]|nr:excinuclease ABC subunit UvrA [Bacteroidales bacterium]
MQQNAGGNINPREYIIIKGARVHNLKNIDVALKRNSLVVITGLSGSGKSSLAFDTLYSEGQRRYVESLSAYARQFLGRMHKPEVDYIQGISPAIAIEQKVLSRNPRSTVGTSTEIYDYLKLLFARIGKTYSPVSGNQVVRHSVTGIVEQIMSLPEDTRVMILTPVEIKSGRTLQQHLQVLLQQGFSRVLIQDEVRRIDELLAEPLPESALKKTCIVIDRISVKKDGSELIQRVADSVQTAFYEGNGACKIHFEKHGEWRKMRFSNRFELDGITFEEPSVNLFSFNNPFGACKVCEGFGSIIGIDPDLVIPNKALSVFEGAIACWKGEKMGQWQEQLINSAYKFDFPIHKPISQLSKEQLELLWAGNQFFNGLDEFFKMVEENTYKIQYRVMLSRYRGKRTCPDCQGTRLRKDANYVKVAGKAISELVLMPIASLCAFFQNIVLDRTEREIARRLLIEINNRLAYLNDVGLGYLTLNRLSNTLSGGESQRINLATSLGSSLVGSMYILDEPSIGLHQRDTHRLIEVLKKLRDAGNTVIVVEHDEDIMRNADQLVDIGPLAGSHGGEIVFQGAFADLLKHHGSLTSAYLSGGMKIPVPEFRRKWKEFIELKGVRQNNLKGFDVKIPLRIMTAITGVSGSGKSSLVKTILFPALKKIYGGYGEKTGQFDALDGDIGSISEVEYIDQNPIGRSSRSNPVTYLKVYDDIRNLFAEQSLAKTRGYTAGFFSFNVDNGRCPECEGDGFVKIEMQFMADISLVCDSCKGKRFREEILDVTFQGKTITDILDLTVDDAMHFFESTNKNCNLCKKIAIRLQPLADVGLGYVRLGQPSATLSGGEAQRLKLASFLARGITSAKTLFIFDEPTTGLHFHDIKKLLDAFNALIDQGHSMVIIEHNPEVIKSADWVIDLGPEGGAEGGYLIFEGIPENLVNCENSYTGKFLKEKLQKSDA